MRRRWTSRGCCGSCARAVDPRELVRFIDGAPPLYRHLLAIGRPEFLDAMREAWLEAHARTYGFARHERNAWVPTSEIIALEGFGVDFAAPSRADPGLSVGAWLQTRLHPDACYWWRCTLEARTPPLGADGARAVMEATHPRLGADAPLGRLPVDVLRALLEALLRRRS